jgi:hypothetical protein
MTPCCVVTVEYFEIYSGKFDAGQVCLGGNGCDYATAPFCSHYIAFVGPDDLEPFFPGMASSTARYFDGDSDYVAIPRLDGHNPSGSPKGSFETITIDTWVKFMDTTGDHPIMNEDHWDAGDLHFQIYNGVFGFDVNNGVDDRGDNAFRWQPTVTTWEYISVTYAIPTSDLKLYVNNMLVETVTPAQPQVPITLDSPRLGSWLDTTGAVTRSMHGQISVFRVWNNLGSSGQDLCPAAQTDGLLLQYVFGESGDVVHDTSGNEKNGQIHNADWSNDVPPSQQCQRQGFGGFFDGDADYVTLPDLGTFDKLTIDVWLKFDEISGEHPVLMEDGWSAGAIHYQIYNDDFVLGINGVGDYKFAFQPRAGVWYFTSVGFDTGQPAADGTPGTPVLKLSVDNIPVDDASQDMGGSFTYTVGNWAGGEADAGTACPCTLPAMQPTHFNSPRLGAWAAEDSNPNGLGANAEVMDRSMRGQIAVFRLWDKVTNGEDRCPASGSGHLVVNYLFDSLTSVLKDRSGNNHDGIIHDTKYSADYPDLSCIFHKDQMWKMMDPIVVGEHGQASVGCTDCQNVDEPAGYVAQQPPTEVNLHEAYTNPIIIPGVPTEHGSDSVVIRVQNLRKYGVAASSGANAGSIEYGDNCDGSDCGHNGRVCETQWCFGTSAEREKLEHFVRL